MPRSPPRSQPLGATPRPLPRPPTKGTRRGATVVVVAEAEGKEARTVSSAAGTAACMVTLLSLPRYCPRGEDGVLATCSLPVAVVVVVVVVVRRGSWTTAAAAVGGGPGDSRERCECGGTELTLRDASDAPHTKRHVQEMFNTSNGIFNFLDLAHRKEAAPPATQSSTAAAAAAAVAAVAAGETEDPGKESGGEGRRVGRRWNLLVDVGRMRAVTEALRAHGRHITRKNPSKKRHRRGEQATCCRAAVPMDGDHEGGAVEGEGQRERLQVLRRHRGHQGARKACHPRASKFLSERCRVSGPGTGAGARELRADAGRGWSSEVGEGRRWWRRSMGPARYRPWSPALPPLPSPGITKRCLRLVFDVLFTLR